ncbi:MAG: hypothetical protein ACK46L_08235, partial [Synechococcaceae cyanobacterium]
MKEQQHFVGARQESEDDMNLLTDGVLTCTYQGMPTVFESIQRYMEERGISQTNSIAFECDNSLTSAIFLLFLLEQEYSFLLLPRQIGLPREEKQIIPRFCQYTAQAETLSDEGNVVDLHYPEQFLRLKRNESSLAVQDGSPK